MPDDEGVLRALEMVEEARLHGLEVETPQGAEGAHAMIHDPLCRGRYQDWERVPTCSDCDLIARVRADERDRIITAIQDQP